jgi:flagellar biosynthesis/type III secretory pathway protein FliH
LALLRQSEAQRIAGDAIALDLGDLARQGDALMARARAQAAALLEQAQQQRAAVMRGIEEQARGEGFEAGTREGFEAGRASGHAQALAESKAKLETLQQAWGKALAEFEAARAAMLEDAREDVLQLAVMLAQRVVKRAIQVDPMLVQDQVSATLAMVARPTSLTVAVHPEDEALAREALATLAISMDAARHATLAIDGALARGSCVVRTAGGGMLDASVDAQLRRIAEALLPERLAEKLSKRLADQSDGAKSEGSA